eukprot:7376207-Prymnesium_polylepis.1
MGISTRHVHVLRKSSLLASLQPAQRVFATANSAQCVCMVLASTRSRPLPPCLVCATFNAQKGDCFAKLSLTSRI